MIGNFWLAQNVVRRRTALLLVCVLLSVVLRSADGSVDEVAAHGGLGESGPLVSVEPRSVHVDVLGIVTVNGLGFTPDAEVDVYVVPAAAAAGGCPSASGNALVEPVTVLADVDGVFSVVRNLADSLTVAGQWAVCAKEGTTLARGDVLSIVTGPMLAVGDVEVVLGDSLGVDGSGFSEGQTVTVFAVSSGEEEDDCGERCSVVVCPAFEVDRHLLAVTGAADAVGGFQGLEFDLDRERFGGSDQWGFCAVGGRGDATAVPLHVHFRRWGAGEDWVLTAGAENVVWFSPPLVGWVVSSVSVGGFSVSSVPQLRTRGGFSELEFVPDMLPGTYTMVVEFEGDTRAYEHLVTVVAGMEPPSVLLGLFLSRESVAIGESVRFTGVGYAPNLTVKVFAVSPDAELEDGRCPGPSRYDGLALVEANSSGGVSGSFVVDSGMFDALGVWRVCAVDGAGGGIEEPLDLTVTPGLRFRTTPVVRFVEYEVEIRPVLPTGTVIEAVTFGGVSVPGPWGFDTTGDYPYFRFSTVREAGRYRLLVELTGGLDSEGVVDVRDATHKPALSVGRRVEYGGVASFVVSGYRANGKVGLVGERLTANNGGLTCGDVSELEVGSLDYVWAPAVAGGDVADSSGVLSAEVDVVAANFDFPGEWLFCVLDRPARVVGDGVQVLLAPSIEVSGDGRVKAGDEVRIEVFPVLTLGQQVGFLKFDGVEVEYTVADGGIAWLEVPRKLGTYVLSAELFGIEVFAPVTVLSGVPPGLGVPGDALECPGLTEFRDLIGPGVQSAVSLRFALGEDGMLRCHVPEIPGFVVGGDLVGVESTTVMPSQELVLEFPPEYQISGGPDVVVMVESFDNRFGHRFVPRGVEVSLSSRDDRNHRVVIPGCGSWYDSRGNQAPCDVELAQGITVVLQGQVTLPTDASQMYATQVKYGDSTIWDLVTFGASIYIVEKEVVYGESISVNGKGFPGDELLKVYGVNTSTEGLALPEGEAGWTCGVVVRHGTLVGGVSRRDTDRFEAIVPTGVGLDVLPGRWDLCVVAEGGLVANEPDSVVVNYLLKPHAADEYEGGSVGYVRVEPALSEDVTNVTLTVAGEGVSSEIMGGDEVHFTAPTGLSGTVRIVVMFNDGLESSLEVPFSALLLGLRVAEGDGLVRVGTMLELWVDRLSGDAVCAVELGGVKLHMLDDGTFVDGCSVVGANRRWRVRVMVLSKDGGVSAPLVDLFEVGGMVDVKAVSTDDEKIGGSVELLKPRVDVMEDGEPIEDSLLLQFKPVLVSGYNFPRETAHFDGVEVGYEVRDERTWQRFSSDGGWSNEFRVKGRTDVGRRLEFVPLIAGHRLEELAFVLTVGVGTPVVLMEPGEVKTGVESTISVSNLLGFVGGYGFVIKSEDGGEFRLLDSTTGRALELVTDADGYAEKTFLFPDYEAFFYDDQGRASIELQLLNTVGEEVPEAIVRVTHVRTEREELPATPAPVPPGGEAVVEFVPFPTARPEAVSALVGVLLPTPTPWRLESRGQLSGPEGPPDGVDHSRVLVEYGANGTTVTLTWLEPVGEFAAEGYLLSRALTRGGKALPATVPHHGGLPLYVDLDVLPDQSYWYYIIAYNGYGLAKSEGITPVEVRTVSAPGIVPRFDKVSDDGGNYVYEWDAPAVEVGRNSPVDGYLIEAKAAEGGEWVVVSRPTGGVHSAVLKKFGDESLVRYRIAAFNGVGGSPWQEWKRPFSNVPRVRPQDGDGFPWLVVLIALALGAGALVGGWYFLRWWLHRPERFPEKPLRAYDAGTWMVDPLEVPAYMAEDAESSGWDDADDGEIGPYGGRLTDELDDDDAGGDGDGDGGSVGSGDDGGGPPLGGDGDEGVGEALVEPGGSREPDTRGVGAPGELRRSVFVYPDPNDGGLGGGSQSGG